MAILNHFTSAAAIDCQHYSMVEKAFNAYAANSVAMLLQQDFWNVDPADPMVHSARFCE